MRKNQPLALQLYNGPGFAHYQSQAAGNELIWNLKSRKLVLRVRRTG